MSGKRPFFLTGANCKIKVNGVTLAFATNIRYSVRINHASPVVLGMYEPSSVEPLSYKVSGQFTVVRYIAQAISSTGTQPHGTSELGNGIGTWGNNQGVLKNIGDLSNGRAYDNLNPVKLEKAALFDIEIYQKIGGGESDTLPASRIRGCRVTGADFDVNKRSVATQTFTFEAIYVDEDSFLADFSGFGQQFA